MSRRRREWRELLMTTRNEFINSNSRGSTFKSFTYTGSCHHFQQQRPSWLMQWIEHQSKWWDLFSTTEESLYQKRVVSSPVLDFFGSHWLLCISTCCWQNPSKLWMVHQRLWCSGRYTIICWGEMNNALLKSILMRVSNIKVLIELTNQISDLLQTVVSQSGDRVQHSKLYFGAVSVLVINIWCDHLMWFPLSMWPSCGDLVVESKLSCTKNLFTYDLQQVCTVLCTEQLSWSFCLFMIW